MLIIIIGTASPNVVSRAGSRRVNASRAPSTSAGGSRTSRASRASRDSRPRGGAAGAAGIGRVPPPRQGGSPTATSTASAVPPAVAANGPSESGTRTRSRIAYAGNAQPAARRRGGGGRGRPGGAAAPGGQPHGDEHGERGAAGDRGERAERERHHDEVLHRVRGDRPAGGDAEHHAGEAECAVLDEQREG